MASSIPGNFANNREKAAEAAAKAVNVAGESLLAIQLCERKSPLSRAFLSRQHSNASPRSSIILYIAHQVALQVGGEFLDGVPADQVVGAYI